MPISFIRETLKYRRESNAWQRKYDARAPKAGDVAPDFELFDVTGVHRIKLSEFEGKKPVALMFGSFT